MSREIDMKVAGVLGWTQMEWHGPLLRGTIDFPPHGLTWLTVPAFSTDLAEAWKLVVLMTASDSPYADQKWSFGLEYSSVVDWVCDFTPRARHPKAREYPAFQASGVSAPEAICKAFLAAVASVQTREPT